MKKINKVAKGKKKKLNIIISGKFFKKHFVSINMHKKTVWNANENKIVPRRELSKIVIKFFCAIDKKLKRNYHAQFHDSLALLL